MSRQSPLVFLWYAAFAAFVVWMIVRWAKRKQQVQEGHQELEALAKSRGWGYERRIVGLADQFSGVYPFPQLSWRQTGEHVLTGTHRDFPCQAFEYEAHHAGSRTSEAGTRPVIHPVWALEVGDFLPDIYIFSKHRSSQQGQSIETGVPVVDENFRITAKDESAARTLIKNGLGEFLTNDPRAAEYPLRITKGKLLTWQSDAHLDPENLDAPFAFLADAAAHLPSS